MLNFFDNSEFPITTSLNITIRTSPFWTLVAHASVSALAKCPAACKYLLYLRTPQQESHQNILLHAAIV